MGWTSKTTTCINTENSKAAEINKNKELVSTQNIIAWNDPIMFNIVIIQKFK